MENTFYYDLKEAAIVVWDNVSEYVKDKFTFEDIYMIIEVEMEIFCELGVSIPEGAPEPVVDYPIDIDWEKLKYEIISRCARNDIYLTNNEIEDILEAELIYYDMNGALGDPGEYLN